MAYTEHMEAQRRWQLRAFSGGDVMVTVYGAARRFHVSLRSLDFPHLEPFFYPERGRDRCSTEFEHAAEWAWANLDWFRAEVRRLAASD